MAFDPNKITFFARTDARGKNVQFGIKAKDRQRHVYVIGKTGMGKSTVLENMAVQDIQNGEGMAFIDPHGSAAETILNYIPEHRIKDVLYFAPFDTEHPVSFNIMEDVGPERRHLVVSGLMSVFKKIWIDAWSARMEYILQNTLMALLEYPDSTLLGVNRMLSDKKYRDLVVANVKDPGVKAFWVEEFAKYNERYMQEAGDAIKNKIGQFTANPIIRNIIGQPKSSFDIRKIMDEKKILIMNLSKGLIGESNANLLGSMLTTRIYLAAMSRADLPPEKMREMPNFYFYVDEFQSFANATFANILSEARKYHLNLTIAHQYITQMEEEVRDAVFGNVGTIISFRVGPLDAELLETIFTPQFLATDIVNLSFAQIYLTLMIDGIGSQPFSATTLPPIAPPSISYKEMAIAESRKVFTRARALVEEEIHKFHEPIVVPKRVVEKPEVREQVVTPKVEEKVQTERPKEENHSHRTPERHNGNGERPKHQNRESYPPRRDVVGRPNQEGERQKTPTPVKREQNADALRSVLKRITTEDASQGAKSQPQKEKPELRNALQEVLAKVESKPVAAPIPKKSTEPNMSVSIKENSSTEVRETPDRKTESNTVTPKELERMMRVTTNDKPPV